MSKKFKYQIPFRCSETMHTKILQKVQHLELASISDYLRQLVAKDLGGIDVPETNRDEQADQKVYTGTISSTNLQFE